MADKKSAVVNEIVQDINENGFECDITTKPAHVDKYFVNNIIQKAISCLYGWYGGLFKRIHATANGELKVENKEIPFSAIECDQKTGADTNTTYTFNDTCDRIDIFCRTNPVTLYFTLPTGQNMNDILLQAGEFYSIDIQASAVVYKNTTPGSNTSLQFVMTRRA